jgi:hypothetical protein
MIATTVGRDGANSTAEVIDHSEKSGRQLPIAATQAPRL